MKSWIERKELTARELIEILKQYPGDAKVGIQVETSHGSFSSQKIGVDFYGNYLDLICES